MRTVKSKKSLKKNKSKKQLDLIERSKVRNHEKSILKEKKGKTKIQSPQSKLLKRIKSSTGLHDRKVHIN